MATAFSLLVFNIWTQYDSSMLICYVHSLLFSWLSSYTISSSQVRLQGLPWIWLLYLILHTHTLSACIYNLLTLSIACLAFLIVHSLVWSAGSAAGGFKAFLESSKLFRAFLPSCNLLSLPPGLEFCSSLLWCFVLPCLSLSLQLSNYYLYLVLKVGRSVPNS